MTIEEFAVAVQTQIAAAAGLAGSKVIWENPNVPRPARPFLALSILEDGDVQPLPEESIEDNPDVDESTYAVADLMQVATPPLFDPGARIETTVPGFTPNVDYENWRVLFTGVPSPVYVPDPAAVVWTRPTLTVNIQPGITTGEDIVSGIFSFLGSSDAPFNIIATGLTQTLATPSQISFDGGSLPQNPILINATDRPEIIVRVTAFTDAPKTGAVSPAFTMLKQVRRVLGGELAADALDPISVLDRGNVHNVTVMLETGYEGRAVLDLKFGSIETESDSVNTIETVIVEAEIKDAEGSQIVFDTITLPNE